MKILRFIIPTLLLSFLSSPAWGQMGSVRISSMPSGARVVIDGQTVGITPYTLKRKPSDYQIVLEKDGYSPKKIYIEIYVDEDLEEPTIVLTPREVGVTISVEGNANGEVYLDGETVIATNKKILIPPGQHTFTVKSQGQEDVIKDVIIPVGKDTSIVLPSPWRSLMGTLVVSTNESGGRLNVKNPSGVVVHDKKMYQKEERLELPVGTYYVSVIKDGYTTAASGKMVTLEWNKETTVKLKLSKNETISTLNNKKQTDTWSTTVSRHSTQPITHTDKNTTYSNGNSSDDQYKHFKHYLEFGGYALSYKDNDDDDPVDNHYGVSIAYTFIPKRIGGYAIIGGGESFMFIGGVALRLPPLLENSLDWRILVGYGYSQDINNGVFNVGLQFGINDDEGGKGICPYSASLEAMFSSEWTGANIGLSWRLGLGFISVGVGIALIGVLASN